MNCAYVVAPPAPPGPWGGLGGGVHSPAAATPALTYVLLTGTAAVSLLTSYVTPVTYSPCFCTPLVTKRPKTKTRLKVEIKTSKTTEGEKKNGGKKATSSVMSECEWTELFFPPCF
jgi:hypothetical protein